MADAEQQQPQQPAASEEEAEASTVIVDAAAENLNSEPEDDDTEFGLNDPLAVVLPRVAPPDADVFLAARLGDCSRLRDILSESPELVNSRDRFDATVRESERVSFFFSLALSFSLFAFFYYPTPSYLSPSPPSLSRSLSSSPRSAAAWTPSNSS